MVRPNVWQRAKCYGLSFHITTIVTSNSINTTFDSTPCLCVCLLIGLSVCLFINLPASLFPPLYSPALLLALPRPLIQSPPTKTKQPLSPPSAPPPPLHYPTLLPPFPLAHMAP